MIERTLILAKHDAVQRGIVGEIVKRFEQKGFRIAGMKMILPDEKQLGDHYADDLNWKLSVGKKTRETFAKKGIEMKETDEEIGARIRGWNMQGLRGSQIVAIIFEGYHAVEAGRKIVGHTEPRQAAIGTIRGDYSYESFALADKDKRVVRNIVHASGSKEEAENEIKIWFKPEEIFDYPKKDWDVIHKF
jgi:nucleoside-diphosphate kinase